VSGFAALRGGYGAALVTGPDRLILTVTGHRPSPTTRTVARALGARHVLQALATSGAPGPLVLALGAEADLAHAASMLAVAAADPGRRRAALVDGLVAACLTAVGVWFTKTGPGLIGGRAHGQKSLAGLAAAREDAAARVARWALPGALRRWVIDR